MSVKELNRDDLLNRFVSHTFTETIVDSMTLVEFKDGGSTVVGAAKTIVVDDAYRIIREDLVGDLSILHLLTTTERDALSSVDDGQQIFNITDNEQQSFDGTVWVSGGVGIDLGTFDANAALFPSSNPAVADSRNSHPIIAFDDTVAENVLFSYFVPENYIGGDINIDIDWVAATATTGGVTWGIEIERNAPGGTDIDSDSFATQQTGTSTTNGTSGIITRTTITLTQAQADAISASNAYRMRIQRVVGDGGDDMTGDAQIIIISGRG